ncbi:hypothetical protein WICANDRAFT_29884 [Wickerhamomyces anomalus NRRL Y-366-8]|uniref:Uncharacterized protein n=1 Tax=Wickerhamomyces anomalus (strain ATCC 58044 / CBS 1984 / NCYC 433 / NRRL Y-366-8) TaxID=683960 RepID=A0A1E3P3L8_WICAA|nr:uncharacterized protein WICANDRAFT_29884 [Wickerhamomyces anomalus NRRL Y-366-8]ODQ60081.1 hypothetical protein WICANDRAFT_29884 [Wickerhamomyces anomalus NRRL Y-366-8]
MDPRVRNLYKRLLWIGRDYPQGYDYFKGKLRKGFIKNRQLEGQEVEKALEKGEFIYKGESNCFLNQ